MKPLLITFKPSITLCVMVTVMSLLMAGILIPLNVYWQIKLTIILLIMLAAVHALSRYGLLRLPSSCVALMVNIKNELQLTQKDGSQLINLSVTTDSVVTPGLIVLGYHQYNATLFSRVFCARLIIFPDALDAESYRQLSVWLRWGMQRTEHSN